MSQPPEKKKRTRRSSQKEPTPQKTKIPNIDWTANNSYLLWQILAEAEKEANCKVLFGKQKGQNSSSEHKTAVYKRIAEIVIPKLYAQDPGTAGERVKGRISALVGTYRIYACNVTSTGGGIQKAALLSKQAAKLAVAAANAENGEVEAAWIGSMPRDGPDEDTPISARNIWQELEQRWPFFPRMHRLLCTRPNVVPIAITTGTGPEGESTVYYQLPPPASQGSSTSTDDANIDPALRGLDINQPSSSASVTLPATPAPVAASQKVSTPSTPSATSNQERLAAAVAKANNTIKMIPKKRTIEEHFLDATQESLRLARSRMESKEADRRAQRELEQRRQLMEEVKLGLISKEQYRTLVYGPDGTPTMQSTLFSHSAPRRARSPSVTWSIEDDEEELHPTGSDDVVGSDWSR